jgi:hypothetical protein
LATYSEHLDCFLNRSRSLAGAENTPAIEQFLSAPAAKVAAADCKDLIATDCPVRVSGLLSSLANLGRWRTHNGNVDRPLRRIIFYIGNAKRAARNLVEFLDLINGAEDFGAAHCFDVINATL